MKEGLQRELEELNTAIKQVGRDAKLAPDLQGKLTLQKQKKELGTTRKNKQRDLFTAQNEIEARKDVLSAEVEARLQKKVERTELFLIAWEVR